MIPNKQRKEECQRRGRRTDAASEVGENVIKGKGGLESLQTQIIKGIQVQRHQEKEAIVRTQLPTRRSWMTFYTMTGIACLIAGRPLLPLPTQAQVVNPTAGVVCDQRTRRCYDSQGISLALTQQYFGQLAVQNLSDRQDSRQDYTDFRLSNGAACSTSQRTCWSDGWGKRRVDTALTQQLYGGDRSYLSNNPNRIDQTDAGYCQLYRRSQSLYSGACTLRKISYTDNTRTRLDATLQNGSTYSFLQRDGSTVTQDSNGYTWPVTGSVDGRRATFRWADMQLMATRTDYIYGQTEPLLNENPGRGLINLLYFLFR
jgi:hypothetical protein